MTNMQAYNLFDELFGNLEFTDDFGWSSEWNREIEKWLTFVKSKDSKYYESHRRRATSDKQRDELLGEYKSGLFYRGEVALQNY